MSSRFCLAIISVMRPRAVEIERFHWLHLSAAVCAKEVEASALA